MNAAVIVAAKQKQLIRRFTEAGATDPATARTPEDVGVRTSVVFNSLVRRGVLVAGEGGRFHLDLAAAERFRGRQRRVMLIVFAIVLILAVAAAWFGRAVQ